MILYNIFQIVACHAYDKVDNVTRCSKRAITNDVTEPDPSLDVIDPANFTKTPIEVSMLSHTFPF